RQPRWRAHDGRADAARARPRLIDQDRNARSLVRHTRIYVTVAGVLAAAAAATMLVMDGQQPYRFHYENVLGTSLDLTVVAPSERDAKTAESAVLTRVDL